MWRFAESLRKKSQQTDMGVAGVAVGHAPHPSVKSNAVVLSASSTPVGKSAHAV